MCNENLTLGRTYDIYSKLAVKTTLQHLEVITKGTKLHHWYKSNLLQADRKSSSEIMFTAVLIIVVDVRIIRNIVSNWPSVRNFIALLNRIYDIRYYNIIYYNVRLAKLELLNVLHKFRMLLCCFKGELILQ